MNTHDIQQGVKWGFIVWAIGVIAYLLLSTIDQGASDVKGFGAFVNRTFHISQ